MRRKLRKSFFEREAEFVAEKLLGTFLVRRYRGKVTALMITEVEAYNGPFDKASHASRGRTERNKIMFGEAGRWYVYFTYGMYWMLNVVTGPKNYPAAVLVRGTSEVIGPGRLTKFLRIDKKFNGTSAVGRGDLWIEDRGVRIKKSQIKQTARIGVHYAGPYWSKKEYRFVLRDS
ncbi:MAG: 3-methyladenine DNA glycosylase [Candidatus Colwellbacteria bacterium RIFCSPHIGHO2_12_FULL_44_17]|uniref:Putative 3-methyladenine DNA glycosylase n=2 Tax=Candidatus Colwelliibacteriota TaxID=1817904 RepID=A0A1G1Z674_9BACT|nr:MAG: 3-methyladenine DNA glycosylase [Candidatus Colwellbacteria bacterium RIFCSPHIGHO2_12_FULL_44_17]OGY60123.1 MAG: 3-methyladenine DNA glycosylase [Candidatus Colwellbacteria bacterium RIFCSPLOWO2_02_FULL_44_20b]